MNLPEYNNIWTLCLKLRLKRAASNGVQFNFKNGSNSNCASTYK